jgi:hypothetical protein
MILKRRAESVNAAKPLGQGQQHIFAGKAGQMRNAECGMGN